MACGASRAVFVLATGMLMLLAGCTPALSGWHRSPVPAAGDGSVVHRAVVIAAGEPRRDTRTVDAVCDVLVAHGWQRDNMLLLLGDDATRDAILEEPFTWLHNQGEDADDVTLFFFSLHGDQTPDVAPLDEPDSLDEYVCPADFEPGDNATYLLDDTLAERFTSIRSDNLVAIFETCHSGGMLDGSSDLRASGRVVLASCAADETSFPVYLNGRWLFPHYLAQGLRGPADTAGDGHISAEEAFRYAEQPTIIRSAITGIFLFLLTPTPLLVQHPQMYDGWPSAANNTAMLDIVPA